MKKVKLTFAVILATLFVLAGTSIGFGVSSAKAQTVPSPASISISPSWTSITDGESQQFSATALDQSGSPLATQPTFTWSTFNPGLGSINQNGLFTPLTNGQMTIYVKSGGVIGTANITVTPATNPIIKSVIVSPINPNVGFGGTLQLTATALDQNWTALATQPNFSWSLNNTAIATIDPGSGLFTALSSGTVIATAATTNTGAATWSGTTSITIQNAPPVLTKINVTPQNPTINSGTTQQFSAETLDQYGQFINSAVIWSSDNTGVGTVDSINGLVTGIAPGNTNVTATSGAISGSASFTVQSAPPVATTIKISPSESNISVGSTQKFSAAILDQYGNPISAAISWTSSDNSVGTIESSGLFTAIGAGNAVITASSGTVSGKASANVAAIVNVAPKSVVSPEGPITIEGISVTNLTNNSATINWTTPTESTGSVVFGTKTTKNKKTKVTSIYRGKTIADSKTGAIHSVKLSGLKKNTKYFFKIDGNDASGSATSAIQSFKVLKNVPTIQVGSSELPNLTIGNITANSATISWTTSSDTTGSLDLSTNKKKLKIVSSDSNVGKNHSIALSGLRRNKKYYFNIVIQKNDGSNDLFSATLSFKTLKI